MVFDLSSNHIRSQEDMTEFPQQQQQQTNVEQQKNLEKGTVFHVVAALKEHKKFKT